MFWQGDHHVGHWSTFLVQSYSRLGWVPKRTFGIIRSFFRLHALPFTQPFTQSTGGNVN